MNIVCVIVICVLMETWGDVIFNSKDFPAWANTTIPDTPENLCNVTKFVGGNVYEAGWAI